jgi:hypothetical protein
MFKFGFLDGMSQSVSLPEDETHTFGLFARWLYRDIIDLPATHDETAFAFALIDLFCFAEKYCIVVLADKVMDTLCGRLRVWRQSLPMDSVVRGYKVTHQTSKLRLLLPRSYTYCLITNKNDPCWKAEIFLPKECTNMDEILLHSFNLLRALNPAPKIGELLGNPAFAPACDYHQHGKDESCLYASKKDSGITQMHNRAFSNWNMAIGWRHQERTCLEVVSLATEQ